MKPQALQIRPEQKKGSGKEGFISVNRGLGSGQKLAVPVEWVGLRAGQAFVLALGPMLIAKAPVGRNAAPHQPQAPEEGDPQRPGNFGVERAAEMVRRGEGPDNPKRGVHEQERQQVRLKAGAGFGLLPQVGVALQGFHERGDEVDGG